MHKKVVTITNSEKIAEEVAEDYRRKGYAVKVARTILGNCEVCLVALPKKGQ